MIHQFCLRNLNNQVCSFLSMLGKDYYFVLFTVWGVKLWVQRILQGIYACFMDMCKIVYYRTSHKVSYFLSYLENNNQDYHLIWSLVCTFFFMVMKVMYGCRWTVVLIAVNFIDRKSVTIKERVLNVEFGRVNNS